MSQDTSYRILIVDDDSTIRDNLQQYLANYHQGDYELEISEASTAEEAKAFLANAKFDVIISDINLPDEDGFYILNEAARLQPHIRKALLTAYDIDSYISMVKEEKIYNILVKTAPFNFAELSSLVNNLISPEEAFGLDKYMEPTEPFHKIVLKTSDDIMTSVEELKGYFRECQLPDADILSIALVEAITNAVYHSVKNPDGTLRYKKGEHIAEMKPEEQVIITYGKDDEKVGISILDQGGSMAADDVVYWLERNISGQSLLDTHGRGLYLIHKLMDRMIVNLQKGKHTELILFHYLQQMPQDNKPLYINEIPETAG